MPEADMPERRACEPAVQEKFSCLGMELSFHLRGVPEPEGKQEDWNRQEKTVPIS